MHNFSQKAMKTIALVLGFLVSAGNAAIVQNDVIVSGGDPGAPPYYSDSKVIHMTSTPFCVIQIASDGISEFAFNYWGIAEFYRLFEVAEGEVIDADFANVEPSVLGSIGLLNSFVLTLNPGATKMFAYWDQGNGPPRSIAEDGDIFGWLEVENSGGELVVIASATSTNSGIYAGTLIPVPEVGVSFLLPLSVILLLHRRRI